MIVDIYTHIFPQKAYERMEMIAPNLENIGKRIRNMRFLHDLDGRFREMDEFGDYRQIVSLPNPPIEDITTPEQGAELARVANDAMAELVDRHTDRFPAFVAAVGLHDVDAAVREIHRAIGDLGARGIQLFTNVAGRPLDDPEFAPVFDAMAEYGLPIWLHPSRGAETSDYAAETHARFETWISLGWPYATSVAMLRLIITGLFDRHPGIKIITHHLGGMIPYHTGRMESAFNNMGRRTSDEDYLPLRNALRRPALDYFRMFYGDTAMHGALEATQCGLAFFGPNNVVFASDAPFGSIRKNLDMIERLGLDGEAKKKILLGNAERLMKTALA